MSRDLPHNLLLNRLKEGDPTVRGELPKNAIHDDKRFEKKLTIAWESGRRRAFLYRDYCGSDYHPTDMPGALVLYFYGWKVVLKGHNLLHLYSLMRRDRMKTIAVIPSRYIPLAGDRKYVVTEASVEKGR